MTRPFFARERVSDFDIFERHTNATLNVLSKVAGSPIPALDIQDLFTRFSLDSSTEFLFGQCLHTLDAPRPMPGQATSGPKGSNVADFEEGNQFGDFVAAFEKLQIIMSLRFKYAFVIARV